MPEPQKTPNVFNALDRDAPIDISSRNLPHWYQAGAATFVTFRTADSLPKQAIDRMVAELTEWLAARNLPLHIASACLHNQGVAYRNGLSQLDRKQQRLFQKVVSDWMHRSLDECYGDCLLRSPELSVIVADAIRYFNGVRYDLDSFVVMPNHVHVLVQFRKEFDLQVIGSSWMRYTARLINQKLGRRGIFWKPEPFDHLIRSPEHLAHFRSYIRENPRKANLPTRDFLYWNRAELG
ncbi:transposase [Pirellula sp. SH-Sr6A]|uniref:transposase n=1 Tax=Pirellula sp. SH-Sr6A TaxID=1632865 RepID=UPI0011BABFC0|nr:transposase [Pirellula sp. SH-Sr6A]